MPNFEEKLPSEIPLVVLDTETTGLFPALGHRVVEVGAIRLENWRITGEISQLIFPERNMDPKASTVNGIYDEDLVGQPTFREVAHRLIDLTDGALLVAHNASFDAGFIGMELSIANARDETGRPAATLPNPWLCTLQLARRCFYFGSNNLGYIARSLGVRMGRAHRALNDVYMTAEILKRMIRDLSKQRLRTVGDLLLAQGGPIYAPPSPDLNLPPIIAEALNEGRALRILYMGQGGETSRIITPRYPTTRNGVAYLIAYCHLRRDQRTFRLDRIFSAALILET